MTTIELATKSHAATRKHETSAKGNQVRSEVGSDDLSLENRPFLGSLGRQTTLQPKMREANTVQQANT